MASAGGPGEAGRAGVMIDDPSDPRLAPFYGLRDQAERRRRESPGGDMASVFMAEGITVIQRARRAGMQLRSVLVDAAGAELVLEEVGELAPVYIAGPAVLAEVAGRAHLRDAIACFSRPEATPVGDILARARTVAVLEGVVNPTNMGVIARCAAALGCEGLLVDPTSVDPLYRRSVRVSMGEVFAIPHARLEALPAGLDPVIGAGFSLVALTPDAAADDIDDYERRPHERLAIMVGTEGPGLSRGALAAASARLRIPMVAGVDSLNVATAAAVAFHVLRFR